jgi:hypothetical protein
VADKFKNESHKNKYYTEPCSTILNLTIGTYIAIFDFPFKNCKRHLFDVKIAKG